ncbi:unnamed protein product [Dracunculus medinensis]|uniref:NopRA1 domain-containing protein n=1 Tax=Dracunculus medinensis TaxID=318479 RepID=A0A0N4U150_DRAME|nr:unnamed protein product [Dracunculus medinensis]
MAGSRKRKFYEVSDENIAIQKFKRYHQKICDASIDLPIEKPIRRMNRILIDSKDDVFIFVDFAKYVRKSVDIKLIICLLSRYNASLSAFDTSIFDLLRILERTYQINLSAFFPLTWSSQAKDSYQQLQNFGATLHNRLTSDQVLGHLDPERVWLSLLAIDAKKVKCDQNLYDPRFLLRCFISTVEEGSDVNFFQKFFLTNNFQLTARKFIDSNALSFAFAATSCSDKKERAVSYYILRRFLERLNELSAENFVEKPLFAYLLRIFRNSIPRPNERLPHVVSHFFARTSKLLLNPSDSVYASILAFLTLKPTVDIGNVPEFYKLFLSSSTHFHNDERHWILKLLSGAMIEPNDYNILQKKSGITLCLSLFASNISDRITRKYILLILRSVLKFPSLAYDLFHRHNFHSWIALTIQQSFISQWDAVFLCQLFITLYEQIKSYCLIKRKNPMKLGSVSMKQRMLQMVAPKVDFLLF